MTKETIDPYVIGRHVFANLYGIGREKLTNLEYIRDLAVRAAKEANMTIVDVHAWSFGGIKGGVSVIVLVNESHLAIHTWSEYDYATVDIYTCGDASDPWKALEVIMEELNPARYRVGYADRSSYTVGEPING